MEPDYQANMDDRFVAHFAIVILKITYCSVTWLDQLTLAKANRRSTY